ncbi:MAG: MBL fold metallo-hydrolase [Myxococcales bacterium]|nr:MBL fold metallo-hydrolase [Myxococcales bacterium]
MAAISPFETDNRGRPVSPAEVRTDRGRRIVLLPVMTFPGHRNNLYWIESEGGGILFDVGTPYGNAELERQVAAANSSFGTAIDLDRLQLAVLSHAHIDHFGNAQRFRDAGVPIAIHELDARVLECFVERLMLASRDVGIFLRQAGVREEVTARLLKVYRFEKTIFRELAPDIRLRGEDRIDETLRLLHVPGHCPGMICLAVDDVILTADHLLSRITPTISPQSITPFSGLEHYLRSLERLRRFDTFALGLGGHEAPVPDVHRRIDECVAHHTARLQRVEALCETPRTIAELSQTMFGEQKGYGILLALLEAGAHVEYLHQLGRLTIANIDDVADRFDLPVLYQNKLEAATI